MATQNKRLLGIVLVAAFLLLLPFIAMQFTPAVNWSTSDFIIAGILLLGTGLVCELVLRMIHKPALRLILCAMLLLALLLVWAELAVGVFGTPFAGS
ncbi:hypothetical protein ACXYMU_13390 [Pontibacter sp. CAU 1760]